MKDWKYERDFHIAIHKELHEQLYVPLIDEPILDILYNRLREPVYKRLRMGLEVFLRERVL